MLQRLNGKTDFSVFFCWVKFKL